MSKKSVEERLEDAVKVCTAAYQAAGDSDWPEAWLDILSNVMLGEPLQHDPESLLPFVRAATK